MLCVSQGVQMAVLSELSESKADEFYPRPSEDDESNDEGLPSLYMWRRRPKPVLSRFYNILSAIYP